MYRYINIPAFILLTLLVNFSHAPSAQAEDGDIPAILSAPALTPFDKDPSTLSITQRWSVMIHGLRYAPLDPFTWGVLKRDTTDNRRLVPMRPFYLRSSEDRDFKVKEISVTFSFYKADPGYVARVPHMKDSILEIGFQGKYQPDPSSPIPLIDQSKILKLSAIEIISSGVFERTRSKITPINSTRIANLETGVKYSVALKFSDDQMQAYLNDKQIAQVADKNINRGLISLMTGWNPLGVEQLLITSDNKVESGLLDYAKFKIN